VSFLPQRHRSAPRHLPAQSRLPADWLGHGHPPVVLAPASAGWSVSGRTQEERRSGGSVTNGSDLVNRPEVLVAGIWQRPTACLSVAPQRFAMDSRLSAIPTMPSARASLRPQRPKAPRRRTRSWESSPALSEEERAPVHGGPVSRSDRVSVSRNPWASPALEGRVDHGHEGFTPKPLPDAMRWRRPRTRDCPGSRPD